MAIVDFSGEVMDILKEFGIEATEALGQSIEETAKESAKRLKSNSPKGRTGRYAKGWTTKIERGRLTTSATVHGKSGTYQLAHLLEFGHAKRGGGRVGGIVHIAPVEQWAVEEVEKRFAQKLGGI